MKKKKKKKEEEKKKMKKKKTKNEKLINFSCMYENHIDEEDKKEGG